jgi:hypothetical protein
MAGLAGQIGISEKAVTFVDNHDTFVQGSAFLEITYLKLTLIFLLTLEFHVFCATLLWRNLY